MTMQSELVLLILCSTSLLLKLSVLIARFFVKDHGVYVMAAKGEKTVMGCTMSVTPMVLIRIQRILTSSGTGCVMPVAEMILRIPLELDPRSIELQPYQTLPENYAFRDGTGSYCRGQNRP